MQYRHSGPGATYGNGRNHDQDSSDPVVLARACDHESVIARR